MTKEIMNKVYDVLVTVAGANEHDRDSFIYVHLDDEYPCREFRFCGFLGFGGKYRINRNRIDYYSEDETPEMKCIAEKVNEQLSKISMVDLRTCKAGDKLLTSHGLILTYVEQLGVSDYYDHKVKYPDTGPYGPDSYGTRCDDGFVFRKNRLPEDQDIVEILG